MQTPGTAWDYFGETSCGTMPFKRNFPRDFGGTLPGLIAAILSEKVTVGYWGVHGTPPVPGTHR